MASDQGDEPDDKQFRIPTGYDGLVKWLRDGLDPERTELRLSTVAHELRWSAGQVTLACRTADGAALELEARTVIVSLPHAVLKHGALRIDPAVPAKQRALEQLEAGQIFKIVMRFREAFWDKADFMASRMARGGQNGTGLNFVHSHGADLPTWWTTLPARTPLITGWGGGPRAEAILGESPEGRLDRSLATLAQVLGVRRRQLDELLDGWSSHDWRADPFSRAAYTYVGVGGNGAPAALARAVQGTLFFAGEATNGEQIGTVAGAIASGRRAAREVLRALRP
jgi:monoamine oxidase